MRVRLDNAHRFREEVRARQAMAAVAGRSKRRKRQPKSRVPRSQELQYRRYLLSIVKETSDLIDELLMPAVDRLGEQTRAMRPDSRVRLDAPSDEIQAIIDQIRERMASRILSSDSLRRAAESIAQNISQFNRETLNRIFESTIGIPLPSVDPGLGDLLAAFTTDNVNLIRSVPEQLLERVEGAVLRGFRRGMSNRDIAEQVRAGVGVSRRRARLIARDQVASLNGELTQIRQQRMGVTEYTWRTVGDERVRKDHQELDDTRQRWDRPPALGPGHPGEPINCRCIAEPVLDPLFDGL